MSGGRWNYQQFQIAELAETLSSSQVVAFLKAVAETEHIVDWSESGDTLRKDAERKLYDLWVKTFDEVFGS